MPNKLKNFLIVIATIGAGIGNSHPTLAQITPDASLGNESSVVTPNAEVKQETADRIDGGAIRDRNLFHSFSEFNVNEAQRVYFANPNNIEQIFTRVTGNNPSNINGTLGVDGAADLLLLNPNGIIFGENSSLDLEGSFFGTSADSVLFEDETEFSAVQPGSSLLTISVPVGLQMGNNPGSLSVRSPLEVGNSQNFTLVGGEISLSGGDLATTNGITEPENGIIAPGGRVELGSLSTAGIVSLENNSNLAFPQEVPRANIVLKDFLINASAGGKGSVAIFSQNLRLTNSEIVTGIDSRVESTAAQAGDITIDTVEETILEADEGRGSTILNVTGDLSSLSEAIDEVEIINTTGNAGNIFIETGSLSATGFSFIGSFTNGEGNAGSVNINARESIVFQKSAELDTGGGITTTVFLSGTGNGADIKIDAQSLSLNKATISTTTLGAGNAGDITINASDSIFASNSSIEAATLGSGNAGNIIFESETANLTFENKAFVGTPVAQKVSGDLLDLPNPNLSLEGTGKGGNVVVNGRNLVVIKEVAMTTFTGGQVTADGLANAGDIELNISDSVDISDNSVLSTNTIGEGNGGNLIVNSDSISINSNSGLISVTSGESNAGDISLNTKNLTIENGGISTVNTNIGQAGNLKITASESLNINGTVPDRNGGQLPAGLFTSTAGGNAAAGNLTINTKKLGVSNGAQILASTEGNGDGGNITIEADEIQLTGNFAQDINTGIGAVTENAGNGGIINIAANNLAIADGAGISVRSLGDGSAGKIFASIGDSLEIDNGFISSRSGRSFGGEIGIAAGDIRLKGDSSIQTNVNNGAGGGGNIILSADSIVAFDDSDIFSFSADGKGGNITLDTDTFFGANYTSAALNANPQLLDNNNRVDINATGSISGIVELPEIKFLPNSLVKLSEDTLDADEVVANSCVVRKDRGGGTFIVTGSGGLPSRPGDAAIVDYATGDVRPIPNKTSQTSSNDWQPGDPIVEPEKAYRLSNGKLVLSRECN